MVNSKILMINSTESLFMFIYLLVQIGLHLKDFTMASSGFNSHYVKDVLQTILGNFFFSW